MYKFKKKYLAQKDFLNVVFLNLQYHDTAYLIFANLQMFHENKLQTDDAY